MIRALVLILLLIAGPAFGQSSKVHDLATNTTNPIPAGSCLYVDQNSLDTKLCANWAATLGAMLPDLSNMTATALPSAFTLPSPVLTGTVAGANTIPLSILSQIPQRTLLGNTTTGTANVGSGWIVSGTANTVATTTGSLTNGHCVDIDVNGNLVDAGAACSSGGGGGSVTSVGFSVPAASIFGVSGSPITTAGTLGLTTTGTSGGIPYFSSGTQLATSAQMPANHAITGGGAGASPKDSKVTITIPATGSTLTVADGKTATFSASTTFAGVDSKTVTFNNTMTLAAGADSQTFTLPAATDTILGRASTDTLTNKTFDTAGTGNVFKIAGAQLTSISGTGTTVALTTSPTFSTSIATLNSATTAAQIFNGYFGAAVINDVIQSVADIPSGTPFVSDAYGGYLKCGQAISGSNGACVIYFGTGYAAVNNSTVWGINTNIIDGPNTSVDNTRTGRKLVNEYDFTATSTATVVQGASYLGSSTAQPSSANGITIGSLSTQSHGTATWTYAYIAEDGCCTNGVSVGMAAYSGNSVASQPVWLNYTNSAGVEKNYKFFVDTSQTLAISTTAGAGLAVLKVDGTVRLRGYTVDTLPASPGAGDTAYVTDAVACTFASTPVHLGAVVCPVFYNGSAWISG